VDDFLVTIKLRVTVTDADELLRVWRDRDSRTAERLSGEPEMALTLAVQDAVPPPDLSALAGLAPYRGGGHLASVKAEPWREGFSSW
jgi:hypothetical protein